MNADWTFADIWETIAATQPDAAASVHAGRRRSWAEFERRSDGLARFLLDAGCGRQASVAFYLDNRPEYLETFFACSKASFVHVNTNYRYVDDELVYLWDNSDAVAVVFQGRFTATIERIRERVAHVETWIWVDDGVGNRPAWAVPYEWAADTETTPGVRGPWGRSGDDVVMMYTGGTTGMPKGVMWRQGDLIAVTDAANRHSLPLQRDLVDGRSPSVIARTSKHGPVSVPACPLMHGTGLFNSVNTLNLGGCIVTLPSHRFDPVELLDTIEHDSVRSIFIVGDAFAAPIRRCLDAEPDRWDLSSLRVAISSGVMWSEETKQAILCHAPNLIIVDSFGSSEAIGMGRAVSEVGSATRTASFELSADAVVIGDDGELISPGSGTVGRVGLRGFTPVGYYKDPEKSAATFPVIDGVRYSLPGDFATVEADGTINLLGRGSTCINTGGEKVFPEEVEEALKSHPTVADAVVVGLPDEKFGQSVTAIVQPVDGTGVEFDDLIVYIKSRLAHYKAPKRIFLVDDVERAANGKVDYARWTGYAEGALVDC